MLDVVKYQQRPFFFSVKNIAVEQTRNGQDRRHALTAEATHSATLSREHLTASVRRFVRLPTGQYSTYLLRHRFVVDVAVRR